MIREQEPARETQDPTEPIMLLEVVRRQRHAVHHIYTTHNPQSASLILYSAIERRGRTPEEERARRRSGGGAPDGVVRGAHVPHDAEEVRVGID